MKYERKIFGFFVTLPLDTFVCFGGISSSCRMHYLAFNIKGYIGSLRFEPSITGNILSLQSRKRETEILI